MTFRDRLLDGRRVALEGERDSAIVAALSRLGAQVQLVDELSAPFQLPLHALVHDARPDFGSGGDASLQRAIERAWMTAHEVATAALIDSGGRILFIAPARESGQRATAVQAALENLARTLSVEWARFGITSTTLWPGMQTTDEQLAELVCFLISAAGGYFSGCRFEFGIS